MEKVLPWVALKSIRGIGNHLFKRLIDRFKSPEKVFSTSREDLLQVEGISPRLVAAIRDHEIPDRVKEDLDLAAQNGYKVITLSDDDYPAILLQIPDPPPVLYVYGKMQSHVPKIAVVGSRNATGYGISAARRLCRDLASRQITVVSGMARGIDTAAHTGALMGQGETIAVLGSGLGKVYPAENLKLYHRIAQRGAVISEFPIRTAPEAYNFPRRNRIISGLSLGTVVVEAAQKSGSLITARLAAEQNREVFAVPGSIRSFKSSGTHGLIKQGAKLVENVEDILEELQALLSPPAKRDHTAQRHDTQELPTLTDDEAVVFRTLGPYPLHIDDLGRKLAMDPGKLSSIMLTLELKGIVQQFPGKFFSTGEEKS